MLSILSQTLIKKEWHEKKQVSTLLKAYAGFVSKPELEKYDAMQEMKFLQKLASVCISDRFQTEFSYLRNTFVVGDGKKHYFSTAKINSVRTAIEHAKITAVFEKSFTQEQVVLIIQESAALY